MHAIAGAIVFTDGQADTKSLDFYASPNGDSFPIAVVGVGSSQPANDLAVHSIDGPARVLIDTAYTFQVTIQAKGFNNQTIHIAVMQDDEPAGRQAYHITKPDERFTLPFTLTAGSLGIHTLSIIAENMPGESNTANNTRSAIVEVVSEPQLKVLYYSKVANFDVGKIRQALAHDKKIDMDFRLDAILAQKKSRPRNSYQWNEAPEERNDSRLSQDGSEFLDYDVIIFGLYTLQELSRAQIDSLYNFVSDRGGGLIIYANDRIDDKVLFDRNLQALLPFDMFMTPSENPMQPEAPPSLTPEGFRTGILQENDLTAPYAVSSAYFDIISQKPAATTLLRTQMIPLVLIHQVGRGNVCLLNMRNTYRWYREDLDGGLLRKFFSGLTAYIGKIPKKDAGLDIFAERDEADPSSVQVNAFVYDTRFQPVSGATVLIEAGNDVIRLDETGNGKYIAAIQAFDQEALLLHAEAERNGEFLGEKTRSFYLPLLQTEMEHVEKDPVFLEKLAKKTEAAYFELGDINLETWEMFPATREVMQANNTTSIWRRWPLFGGLCIALTLIWFTRRAVGLV